MSRAAALRSVAVITPAVAGQWRESCPGSDREVRFFRWSGTRLPQRLGTVSMAIRHPRVARR